MTAQQPWEPLFILKEIYGIYWSREEIEGFCKRYDITLAVSVAKK